MEELIAQLNALATELLGAATEISDNLNDRSPAALSRATALLGKLCSGLTKTHELLARSDSPLAYLVRRVAGSKLADALDRAQEFLDEHAEALLKLKLPKKKVDQVIKDLKELVTGPGPENLEHAQTILDKPANLDLAMAPPATYKEEILNELAAFRDLVCGLSTVGELAGTILSPPVLKAVAEGVAGVAVVVVDVTGAAAVAPSDITGWVLVKAVKSTWSGVKMIRKSVNVLRDAWGNLQSARMRSAIPPADRGRFQLPPNKPGDAPKK